MSDSSALAKLARFILTSNAVREGHAAHVTLGELARIAHPSAKRIRQRELEATAYALAHLQKFVFPLPNHTRVQIFDCTLPAPDGIVPETVLVLGLGALTSESLPKAMSEHSDAEVEALAVALEIAIAADREESRHAIKV